MLGLVGRVTTMGNQNCFIVFVTRYPARDICSKWIWGRKYAILLLAPLLSVEPIFFGWEGPPPRHHEDSDKNAFSFSSGPSKLPRGLGDEQ